MVKESVAIHGFAGVMGSLSIQILHPFDVIKTRAQASESMHNSNYKNMIVTARNIFHNEGIRSFYKGIGVSVFASNVSYGLFFALYRKSKNYFNDIENFKVKNFISGLVSSVIAVGIVQPLWTIKTRKLLDTNHYNNVRKYNYFINEIYSQYGFKGFYRGYFLSLVLGMNAVIQLSFYDSIKDYYIKNFKSENNNIFTFINGVSSRIIATLIMYPFNTTRTKLQKNQFDSSIVNNKEEKYKNIKETFSKTYKEQGLQGFYRGIFPHLIRSIPSNGLFFIVYENTVFYLKKYRNL